MKKMIIGQRGTGKTTLIVNEFIPELKNYLIFDFCNEYYQWIKDKSKIKLFGGVTGKKLKDQFLATIKEVDNDVVLIIDNTQILCFQTSNDAGFRWLMNELKARKYIIVFQSIQYVIDGEITDIFDQLYCFPTQDDDNLRTKYLLLQMKYNVEIIFKNGIEIPTSKQLTD